MIRFAAYKADGSKCHYVYESEDTIREDYHSEKCILPDNSDGIIYFSIDGVRLCGVGKIICFEQKGRKFITTIEVIKKDVGKMEIIVVIRNHLKKYTAAGKVALHIKNNLVEYVNKLIDKME